MIEAKARAKINWTLDILGTRPDGYHRMDMLMSSVELHDTLLLEAADTLTLAVENADPPGSDGGEGALEAASAPVPGDEKNLVLKAARALQAATGCSLGARMRLIKRIPVGAGMGGGSADAAAALMGLCALWGLPTPQAELLHMAQSLGADVPFALTGGLRRVEGIGEILTPLPAPPPVWLVVAQPCQGLSTPEIFRGFDALPQGEMARPRTEEAEEALRKGDLPALARAMGNVLEAVSLLKRPQIGQAIKAMEAAGALRAMMTGSGSAVYGLFEDEKKARSAYEALQGQWDRLYVTHTAGEGVEMRRGGETFRGDV